MTTEAKLVCACGSELFAIETPETDASKVTCEGCGAVSTYGELMNEATRRAADHGARVVRDAIKRGLGGLPGISVE
jgi:hypothetical protein